MNLLRSVIVLSCLTTMTELPDFQEVVSPPTLPYGVLVDGEAGSIRAACMAVETTQDEAGGVCVVVDSSAVPCLFLGGVVGVCRPSIGANCCGGVGGESCWLLELQYEPPPGRIVMYQFESVF